MEPTRDVEKNWNEEQLKYSMVWEDALLVRSFLNNSNNLNRCLAICSGGDNGFEILASGARELFFVDLSTSQLLLASAKLKAIKSLEYEDYLIMSGFGDPNARKSIFDSFANELNGEEKEFLTRSHFVDHGFLFLGKIDQHFKNFRDNVVPQLWTQEQFVKLIQSKDCNEQLINFKKANPEVLGKEVKTFFSRTGLSQAGRQDIQFLNASQDIEKFFLNHFLGKIADKLIRENFYMYLFLTGKLVADEFRPAHLSQEGFHKIKTGTAKAHFVHGRVEECLDKDFDFALLSNIFEYLTPEQAEHLVGELKKSLNPHSKLLFWTQFLKPKTSPQDWEVCTTDHKDSLWLYSGSVCLKKK